MALLLAQVAHAQGKKPSLPPGNDPGGIAIAVLTTGIDYTLPDVAKRLARDGEGELIGFDMRSADTRPYAAAGSETRANWGGDGTALVQAFGMAGRRVIAIRIDPDSPVTLARAAAFAAQTPARIVVVPMWGDSKEVWEPFRQAAAHFRDLLFVVAAGDEGKDIDEQPVWPAAFGLPNVLVVTAPLSGAKDSALAPNGGEKGVDAVVSATRQPSPGAGAALRAPESTRLAAALAADALAGCWPQLVAAHRGEALKKALLAEAAKAWPNASKPIIERCDGRAAQSR